MLNRLPQMRLFKRTTNVRRLITLYIVSAIALVALVAFGLIKDYNARLAEAERSTKDTALTLQQHLLRSLEATDLTLLRVVDRMRTMDWEQVESSGELWAFMAELADQLPQVRSIWLADAQGHMRLYSAAFPTPNLDVRSRDYFVGAQVTRSGFYVGDPLPGRFTGKPFFSVSRRINDAGGRFRGVVAAAMEPTYYELFHQSLPRAFVCEISIFKTSGMILARHPQGVDPIGHLTVQRETLEQVRSGFDQGSFCDYESRSGIPRILSFHKLPGLPLVVTSSYSINILRAEVLRDMALELATMGLGLLIITGFFFYSLRRVRAEDRFNQQTAERELLFSSIVNNAGAGIIVGDMDGTIRLVNTRTQIMLGYHDNEMVGQDISTIFHPDDVPKARDKLKLMAEGGLEAFTHEIRCIKKDGTVLWTTISTTVKAGETPQAVGILVDISARKQAEERLRESEFKFRTIADFTYDWEFWIRPDYTFAYNSPSCVELTGYTVEEFVANPSLLFDIIVEADRAAVDAELQRGMSRRRHGRVEFRIEHRRTGMRWMAMVFQPIINEDGELAGLRGSCRDVTGRKEAEALREEVERITRHDLKSPLMAAITVPRILKKGDNLTDNQIAMLDELEQSGLRMLNMINESLALYRIETGRYTLEAAPLDLLENVRRVLRDQRASAKARRVTLSLTVHGEVPEEEQAYPIQGEELLIYSMLNNLIKNAVEAAPENTKVHISIERREGTDITIRNRGEVPEEIRDTFFDKYTSSGKRYGTGLGTYSAKRIAETHKGSILLDSSVAGETSVRVHLP